jgi:hypothetical protein
MENIQCLPRRELGLLPFFSSTLGVEETIHSEGVLSAELVLNVMELTLSASMKSVPDTT